MTTPSPFKWRHFEPDMIVCEVRCYLRDSLRYRDVAELMLDRGLHVDHTTIFCWVQRYAPELDKRSRPHLQPTNDSYRMDQTGPVPLAQAAARAGDVGLAMRSQASEALRLDNGPSFYYRMSRK